MEDKTIPLSVETVNRLEAFADGLGGTFDEAINLLISLVSERADNSDVRAGASMRGALARVQSGGKVWERES